MNVYAHAFELEGNYFVLDIRKLCFFKCGMEEYNYINKCITNKKIINDIPPSIEPLEMFAKQGIYFDKRREEKIPFSPKKKILQVAFPPVHKCNYACKYCFADAGKKYNDDCNAYNDKILIEMLDYVYKTLSKDYKEIRFEFVSGGEPLLNSEIIHHFLRKCKIYDEIYNKKTSCFLQTNGSLITQKELSFLDKYNINLGISIDGDEEEHNANRIYIDGKGTYQDTIKGYNIVYNSNVNSQIKNIWAIGVLTKQSKGLVNILKHFEKLKITRAQINLVRGAGTDIAFTLCDWPIIKKYISDLFRMIKNGFAKNDTKLFRMIVNKNDFIGKIISRLLLGRPVAYRCEAGKNKFSICANGDIYPCDSFIGMKEFCLGSIYSGLLPEKVEEFEAINVLSSNCKLCWAKYICGGDCYFNAYIVNGEMGVPDALVCKVNKFIIYHTVDALLSLKEIDFKLFEKEVKIAKMRNEMSV